MHLVARDLHRIDAQDDAVDLGQPPGDVVVLSFSDSDLGALRAARARRPGASLRLANLAALRHPFSVDLYLEKTASHAKAIVVRCLGGADYWRYGVEELAALCRAKTIALAIVPGDSREDARLSAASTMPGDALDRIWRWFDEGGPDNADSTLAFLDSTAGRPARWREPVAVPPAGRIEAACRSPESPLARATIVVYRSLHLAADAAPAHALADALAKRGFAVETLFVTSLKDPRATPIVRAALAAHRPDVILNTTAFSAREAGGGVLDEADAPVVQAAFATITEDAWRASPRGLGAVDLAMNVVLPEVDGRIVAPPISFKAQADEEGASRMVHAPHAEGIAAVVDLARRWARLRRTPRERRNLALVLSDYPLKGGREGYAVGLDSFASVDAILAALREGGFSVGDVPSGGALAPALAASRLAVPLADYRRFASALPQAFRDAVEAAWGPPDDDPAFESGALVLRAISAERLVVAFQPDRGARVDRRAGYHDMGTPPRHAYVAFYLWLREAFGVDAVVHLGTHGTLEWLPGKSVALSGACAPQALTGGVPVVYPFIVNDPGEAAQARRRVGAVTIGHETPPLSETALDGAAADVEALLDEYTQAAGLDPRRAALIADAILDAAQSSGLAAESGLDATTSRDEALTRLDAWLCDVKDLRLGQGLHVFGRDAPGEIAGLLKALDGRFVEPGPAGAPSRARADVRPTGRNLYGADPRAIPTRTAQTLGARAAQAVLDRHLQDHGEWPRALMVDLWGSATMRTGGEDFSQAMALMGARPAWDAASARVSGFEVLTPAELGRPRIDVTLRVSGLFRDVFPGLIALFDQAAQAIAALEEDDETNPLAAARRAGASLARVYGAAPGAYGTGIADALARDRGATREALGAAYLDAAGCAFSQRDAAPDPAGFAARLKAVDALVHTQDMAETDILAGGAFAEEEGGFAAAAFTLGARARVYHVDATREGAAKVRTLAEEVARVSRGKFGSRAWIAGMMRHGRRGAAEIAETVGNLALFAVTANCVADASFDLAFDATLGDDAVRAFLDRDNPEAAASIRADFAMARDRGLWTSRRNSVALALGPRQEDAA